MYDTQRGKHITVHVAREIISSTRIQLRFYTTVRPEIRLQLLLQPVIPVIMILSGAGIGPTIFTQLFLVAALISFNLLYREQEERLIWKVVKQLRLQITNGPVPH